MEKVKRKEGRAIDWVALILDKQDKMVDWINEHDEGDMNIIREEE